MFGLPTAGVKARSSRGVTVEGQGDDAAGILFAGRAEPLDEEVNGLVPGCSLPGQSAIHPRPFSGSSGSSGAMHPVGE